MDVTAARGGLIQLGDQFAHGGYARAAGGAHNQAVGTRFGRNADISIGVIDGARRGAGLIEQALHQHSKIGCGGVL